GGDQREPGRVAYQATREPGDEPEPDGCGRPEPPAGAALEDPARGSQHRRPERRKQGEGVRSLRHQIDDRHAGAQPRGRYGEPDPAPAPRASLPGGRGDGRGLRSTENGVGGSEGERQVSGSSTSGWPGVSGRFRMPSRVTYFDHESCSASINSGMN